MPLPVLALVAAAVSALAGGLVLANWNEIIIALKGKRLAILGARRVGKTHLARFLTSGSIPADYKQTVAPEKTAAHRFQLKDLDLKIKKGLDLSGDKANYAEWKELHDQSDIVLYLLRADRLIAGDEEVESRARDDLRQISYWLESRGKQRPLFFIVGTHCDLDREFATLTEDRVGDYMDKFRRLPIMRELVAHSGGACLTKVVLGSMATIESTEALTYQIFSQVKS